MNRLGQLIKSQRIMKFIDIGANLTDSMYSGQYNGSCKHPPDLESVLERAKVAGVEKMMVTGGNLEESKRAVELSQNVGPEPVAVNIIQL